MYLVVQRKRLSLLTTLLLGATFLVLTISRTNAQSNCPVTPVTCPHVCRGSKGSSSQGLGSSSSIYNVVQNETWVETDDNNKENKVVDDTEIIFNNDNDDGMVLVSKIRDASSNATNENNNNNGFIDVYADDDDNDGTILDNENSTLIDAKNPRVSGYTCPNEREFDGAGVKCADVLFVIDRSHSITGGNCRYPTSYEAGTSFRYSKSIAITIAEQLRRWNVNPRSGTNHIGIGMVSFSTTASTTRWYVELGDADDRQVNKVEDTIVSMGKINGPGDYTNTEQALNLVIKNQFPHRTAPCGGSNRSLNPLIVVLITDGTPTVSSDIDFHERFNCCPSQGLLSSAIQAATNLKKAQNVHLLTVGVGIRNTDTCSSLNYASIGSCGDLPVSYCFLKSIASPSVTPSKTKLPYFFPTYSYALNAGQVDNSVEEIVCGINYKRQCVNSASFGVMQGIIDLANTFRPACSVCSGIAQLPTRQPTRLPTTRIRSPTKPTRRPTNYPTAQPFVTPDMGGIDLMILLDHSGSLFGNNPKENALPNICAGLGIGTVVYPSGLNLPWPNGYQPTLDNSDFGKVHACWGAQVALARDVVSKLLTAIGVNGWEYNSPTKQGLRLSVQGFQCTDRQTSPIAKTYLELCNGKVDINDKPCDVSGALNFSPAPGGSPFNQFWNDVFQELNPAKYKAGTCAGLALERFIDQIQDQWKYTVQHGRKRILINFSDMMMYDAIRDSNDIALATKAIVERCTVPLAITPFSSGFLIRTADAIRGKFAKKYGLVLSNYDSKKYLFVSLANFFPAQSPPSHVTVPGNLNIVGSDVAITILNQAIREFDLNPICQDPNAFAPDNKASQYCGYNSLSACQNHRACSWNRGCCNSFAGNCRGQVIDAGNITTTSSSPTNSPITPTSEQTTMNP